MDNNLKNIPKPFLKNIHSKEDYNTDLYISSTKNNKKTQNIYTNDNIWILIIIFIIFDII